MFDIQSVLRALVMASGLQRRLVDPALFTLSRNRDTSLDDLESSAPPFVRDPDDNPGELDSSDPPQSSPPQSPRPVASEGLLAKIMREAKAASAKRDAETNASLKARATQEKQEAAESRKAEYEAKVFGGERRPMQSPIVDRWRNEAANQNAGTTSSTDAIMAPLPQQAQPSLQEHLSTVVSAQLNSSSDKQSQENNTNIKPTELETLGWKDFRAKFSDKNNEFDSDAANEWAVREAQKAIVEKRKFAFRLEGKERRIVRTDGNSMYDAKGRRWGSMAMALGTDDDAFVIERPQTQSDATTATADTSRSPLPPAPQTEPPSPTLEQDLASVVEAQGRVNTDDTRDAESDTKSPSALSTATDVLQMGLDAVGVVDPTPISDGINAVWSLGRAFTDPERRSEHLTNAGISAVSMIPYIGDSAKLLKTGRYAKTASRVAKWNDGASAATKASQRGELRDAAGAMLGGGSPGSDTDAPLNAGGNGGGYEPPGSRSLSPDGDDDDRESEATAKSFFDKLEGAGESLLAFAGPLGKATVTTIGFIKGLELMNSGVIALNKELAPYNAQLSAAYAQYEVDEMNRNIDKGNVMQGPMSKLMEEQSELRTSLDRLSNPLQAMSVGIQAKLTEVVNIMLTATQAVEVSSGVLDGIKAVLFAILGIVDTEAKNIAAQQGFFRDVSDGKFDGKEPAFGGMGRTRMPDFKTEQERKDLFGS